MFIDIHAHLNDERLFSDIDNVLLEAKSSNVGIIVCVGYDFESSLRALKLANDYENIYAVVGVHPHDAKSYDEQFENFFEENKENQKIIAIGEIGLDYHYDNSPREIQKKVFQRQIELAHKFEFPIVVHTREATKDTIEILKKNKGILHGGIVHCCNESLETTNELINLGFSISLGGPITFKNAKNAKVLIENISLEKIMLETDCPYLTPEPYRGKINKPCYLTLIANKIAEIKKVQYSEVEYQTTQNAFRVFKRIKNV